VAKKKVEKISPQTDISSQIKKLEESLKILENAYDIVDKEMGKFRNILEEMEAKRQSIEEAMTVLDEALSILGQEF
jgi:hypothetical protein